MARSLTSLTPPEHRCGGPRCPFRDHAEAELLCGLVPRLAALDVAALIGRGDDLSEVGASFVEAMAEAGDTVRWCRQTAHPGGACWFRSPTGGDCGEILKLAHRLN